MKKFFTVGMAGHIDHGKTSLTKALTNVDTDRLKEEKKRQISIELGFARLVDNEQMEASIVDMPGHERFIRQMIAGSAGINLAVLVVAADEGVMPQTREHLEILEFLGISRGIVALTKSDAVEVDFLELAREEVSLELEGTVFEQSPIVTVSSLTGMGIPELKALIINQLQELGPLDARGSFRMPVDQVFTVKGHGTVARGTVYNGSLREGEDLYLMPQGKKTRARQVQVHGENAAMIRAGQRAAINLGGISQDEAERGNVLTDSPHAAVTSVIDISLKAVKSLEHEIKQRMPVKCYIGTAEVMGKLVFFDRNSLEGTEEVLCQVRLEENIITSRGDRLILRRPSPAETIGGGWVIDPAGKKYKFGPQTIEMLTLKEKGTPSERLLNLIHKEKGIAAGSASSELSLAMEEISGILEEDGWILYKKGFISHISVIDDAEKTIETELSQFHEKDPLKDGMNKAELLSRSKIPGDLFEFVLSRGEQDGKWKRTGSFLKKAGFQPHVPREWEKRSESMMEKILNGGLKAGRFEEYYEAAGLPRTLQTDVLQYFTHKGMLIQLDDQRVVHQGAFNEGTALLKEKVPAGFEVAEAKDILGLSRKHIIPFLEALDQNGLTKREGNQRVWLG
ncbi:selenocysteine-specific translation elongation factor [Peribacillus sp. SCS-37]|uniref:selenocysteine-specific translation elongation factor n=1 Tax=Paraperibacillus esterisolvens TaxID=3115296 RepID=UPI003905A27C